MRLAFPAFCAFYELLESTSCVFSMGVRSSNPTLTAKSFVINYVAYFFGSFSMQLDLFSRP